MFRSTCCALFLLLPLFVQQALPFSEGGHKTVGLIAWNLLSEDERAAVIAILKQHERFKFDFFMPKEIYKDPVQRQQWYFAQAAVWPDHARSFSTAPSNLRESLVEKFHRPSWHFINDPVFVDADAKAALEGQIRSNLNRDPEKDIQKVWNIAQAWQVQLGKAKDPASSPADKALALCWLIHQAGDVHQPLHAATLFSKNLFREGDRGGNSIKVKVKQRNNNRNTNRDPAGNEGGFFNQPGFGTESARALTLHSLWDRSLGGRTSLSDAQKTTLLLLANDNLKEEAVQAAQDLVFDNWISESRKIAGEFTYSTKIRKAVMKVDHDQEARLKTVQVSRAYAREVKTICDRRVMQAGHRLAKVLRSIVSNAE